MDGAEAKELRVLEPGDHPEDALLLRIAEPRLEADEVPHLARAILHAELHDGVRLAPRARVGEPDGLHRPEAQRLAAAPRHLLGGHAALEVRHLVELVRGRLVGGGERVEERLVLLARHRAVEIRAVALALHRLLAVARRAKDDVVIDGVVGDDRRDGVVEGQRLDVRAARGWSRRARSR